MRLYTYLRSKRGSLRQQPENLFVLAMYVEEMAPCLEFGKVGATNIGKIALGKS